MKNFHAWYNPTSRSWVACTAGDAVKRKIITIAYAPPGKPGTFCNPLAVLNNRLRAERVIAAHARQMDQIEIIPRVS